MSIFYFSKIIYTTIYCYSFNPRFKTYFVSILLYIFIQFEKYLISYENILENFKLFDNYEDISSEELTSVLIDIQKYETQLENEIKYKVGDLK